MEASIILTYRCNFKCQMCNTWKYPSDISQEFKPEIINKIPKLKFCNVTGGEPFLREDIEEIVVLLKKKADRIVISTNGFFTEKIVDLAKKNKDIGIRVSIEGLSETNDRLRGQEKGFDHGLRTLLNLKKIGIKDIGFGITVSDENAKDIPDLFDLAKFLNFEFATAVVHNGYYFHAYENQINDKEEVIKYFKILIRRLISSGNPKDWFRAYFNFGLINYINKEKRLLPCKAGTENFFLDPFGNILPCNAMEEKYWFASMGNLNNDSFDEIWYGDAAKRAREMVENCNKNCWMIGTAAPVMKKYLKEPVKWIIQNKLLKNSELQEV